MLTVNGEDKKRNGATCFSEQNDGLRAFNNHLQTKTSLNIDFKALPESEDEIEYLAKLLTRVTNDNKK